MWNNVLSFLQGASNAAASSISAPVDLLSMGLRGVGYSVPADRVLGSSEWMRRMGLTAEPGNRIAGLLGEAAGMSAPIAAAAKAPEIARGLLQVADNVAAPRMLHPQAGMLMIPGRGQAPETATDVKKLADRIESYLGKAGVPYATDKSSLSPARYITIDDPRPGAAGAALKIRVSDHRNIHGADLSIDPQTGATFEEGLRWLKDVGVKGMDAPVARLDQAAKRSADKVSAKMAEMAAKESALIQAVKAGRDPSAKLRRSGTAYWIESPQLPYKRIGERARGDVPPEIKTAGDAALLAYLRDLL